MKTLKSSILWSAIAAFLLAGAAWAQSDAPPASDQTVARLSAISGSVSTQRGDTGDWSAATLNAPLMSGDAVATADGRAEIQLDFADWLRLGPNSQAKLAQLSPDRIQVQVGAGSAELVSHAGGATVEVDSPNMSLTPQGAGAFRVNVDSDSETHAIDRSGSAEIATPQGSTNIQSGDMIDVQGTDEPQYQMVTAPAPDDLDHWSESRDRAISTAQSWQYANPYYTGVDELDGYGRWLYVAGYGQVWMPDQGPAWAPYRAGSWVWEPDFGWTWVSTEPWGWAPYHYGRWFVYNSAWVWWPGPVTPMYRPMWAPAYVSFVGLNMGPVAVGMSFGSIGWVPIGPADPFMPWWGGRAYTTVAIVDVNRYQGGFVVGPLMPARPGIAVFSNIGGVAVDLRLREGVTVVGINEFGHGPVVAAGVVVTPALFRGGVAIGGALPVVPVRESLRVGVRVGPPPVAARVEQARFFTRNPPPARRPFTEEVSRVQQNIHGVATTDRAEPGRTQPASRGGWQRFGAGGNNAPANRGNDAGYRGFGSNAGAGNNAGSGNNNAADANKAAPSGNQPNRTTPPAGAAQKSDGNWHSFNKNQPKPANKDDKSKDGRGGGDGHR